MKVGKLKIPPDIIIALANAFNTSTDYLLGVTDEVTPYPRAKKQKHPALKMIEKR